MLRWMGSFGLIALLPTVVSCTTVSAVRRKDLRVTAIKEAHKNGNDATDAEIVSYSEARSIVNVGGRTYLCRLNVNGTVIQVSEWDCYEQGPSIQDLSDSLCKMNGCK